jgi:hypothetical protein
MALGEAWWEVMKSGFLFWACFLKNRPKTEVAGWVTHEARSTLLAPFFVRTPPKEKR